MDNKSKNIILYEKCIKFEAEWPGQFQKLSEITDSISITAAVYDNRQLFNRITRRIESVFANITDAIYESSKGDFVLINFANIMLYGLFTRDRYVNMIMCELADDVQYDDILINIYQIVLVGKRQKFVFACTNMEFFEKLQKYAQECFGTTIYTSGPQITVNINTQTEEDITNSYSKLYNYIYHKKDIICCDAMRPIQPISVHNYIYRSYDVNDAVTAKNIDEAAKLLRSIPWAGPANIQNLTTAHGQPTTNTAKALADTSAQDWIAQNPPINQEPSSKYYLRYNSTTKAPICIKKFNKLVSTQGHLQKKTSQCQVWISYATLISTPIIQIKFHNMNHSISVQSPELTLQTTCVGPEVDDKKPSIYFIIEIPYADRVKIGMSHNVNKRLKQLQTGCPTQLTIFDQILTIDCRAAERELHLLYADRRINGEWFSMNENELHTARQSAREKYYLCGSGKPD